MNSYCHFDSPIGRLLLASDGEALTGLYMEPSRKAQSTEGWVQEKMITSRRGVIVTGGIHGLRQGPDLGAALVARAEPGVTARLEECRGDWCRITAGDLTGWVQRGEIWGVSATENFPN